MKRKIIKFVTMFPRIENFHLVKDVGMIPYCMNKYYNMDSSIVIYKDKNYDYFDKEIKRVNKDFFPLKAFNSKINCILYLIKNAKKIDVLHLYHLHQKSTIISIPFYFLKNNQGLIYIHLDNNIDPNNKDLINLEGTSLKKTIKRFIYKKIIFTEKNCDRILFGVQKKEDIEILNKQYPFKNIEFITNAYEDVTLNNKKEKKELKENIILFVGRVGSSQKRTDILLEGFKKAYPQLPNWKLRVVGPIENDFQKYILDFKKENPDLVDKVEFVGAITDREELKKEYKKAKIFCLTSDYESFGLVLVEALANGCTIISSDIPTSREILNNREYGNLFECGNSDDLCNVLINTCNDNKKMNYVEKKSKKYISDNYSYNVTLKPLYNWIIEKRMIKNEK